MIKSALQYGNTLHIELDFGNVSLGGGEKPENPEQGRELTTTNSTHMTPRPGIQPGTHWWEASALTTVLSLHPHEASF